VELEPDSVLRAITDDGAFRVIAASTTQTVRDAVVAQQATGVTARCFGELLTASVLFRQTMAPDLRVQSILKTKDGLASILADSHPSGRTRGLVQLRKGAAELDLSGGGIMQVMRTMPGGRINQGMVAIPTEGGVSQALMEYMQISEQVTSTVAVGCVMDETGNIVRAGGYMVQLLPEVERGPLAIMTERLSDFTAIDAVLEQPEFSPRLLLSDLLYGMPFTELDECRVDFGCWCSELRVVSALATLNRKDIADLIGGGEVLQVSCEYCHREYRIAPATLQGLLDES
jgi:molecular chaperone Hsp33